MNNQDPLRKNRLGLGGILLASGAVLLGTVGFAFDLLVYVNAQLQMARGKGAGYW